MIIYQLSFDEAKHHYLHVNMRFTAPTSQKLELYLAVWTPGSYMVREYSRNIVSLEIVDDRGQKVNAPKLNKNTWSFQAQENKTYEVKYQLYANEMTVRTNHVDTTHAMLNGAPTFLTIKGFEKESSTIHIKPPSDWEVISSPLSMIDGNKWIRKAKSFDELVDSPMEIGSHQVIEFQAGGISHELALVGPSNIQEEKTVQDLKNIIEEEVKLFSQPHPCERYLFIMHHTDNLYGGLEHLHSSLNMVPRWSYAPQEKYLQAISLLSHEYFHLWNVKRIRPVELGPFDYTQENYTTQLWAIEGITSYYDDYFVYLAKVSSKKEYLDIVARNINRVVNTPGDELQTLQESSWDAWIKFYRQDENTHNTQVNYYVKGATTMTALNLLILSKTNAELSLDDVMRELYRQYQTDSSKGYTESELLETFNQVCGFELNDFFTNHIEQAQPINYAYYLDLAGLKLVDVSQEKVSLGWTLNSQEGRYIITKIDAGSSLYESGIQAQDEVIAIDGFRMQKSWESILANKKVGDSIEFLVSRYGLIQTFQVELLESTKKEYVIEQIENVTNVQNQIRDAWLKK